MTLARWQGWAGLAIAGVALIAGLITIRGDEAPARRGQPRRAYDYAPPARPGPDLADVPIIRYVPDPDPDPDPAPRHVELSVEVTATALRLDGVAVTPAELTDRARRAADDDPAIEATIISSSDVPYARVIEVMDALRAAGVEKLALSAAP
ncbi:MAG: biopolymer transporter ExbD [Myxococcales bacterium]|nr:biopolymer transporter ExbD [Myxococcales bacterium]